jgi:hypothetical protein
MTNYISKPVLESTGDFIWNWLSVIQIAGKGLGVKIVGKRFIGYRLPYGGVVIESAKEYANLAKKAGKNYVGYQHGRLDFILDGNEEGEVVSWLDAHPRRYFPGMPPEKCLDRVIGE